MCGVLCVISNDGVSLDYALDAMEHRGGFEKGSFQDDNVYLGMTRLPMSGELGLKMPIETNGELLVFNGEIYDQLITGPNDEAEKIVQVFKSHAHTNGMYAAISYNPEEKVVKFVRDPYGIKPLYYLTSKDQTKLIISSEISAILKILKKVDVNIEVLKEVVLAGQQLTEDTVFEGIKLLAPGKSVTVDVTNEELKISETQMKKAEKQKESLLNLKERLELSIHECRRAVREIGLLYSGGVDSSLIRTCSENFKTSLKAIFNDREAEEDTVSCKINANDFWELLKQSILNFSQPSRMSSLVMYQALSNKLAEIGINGVIAGEGADELFFGYPRHEKLRLEDLDDNELIRGAFFNSLESFKCVLSSEASDQLSRKINLRLAKMRGDSSNNVEFFNSLELIFSLEPLLRRSDHLMMANTIEVRTPFLHFGVSDFGNNELTNKTIGLKKQLRDILEEVSGEVHNKKEHFRIPFHKWDSINSEMVEYIYTNKELLSVLGVNINNKGQLQSLPANSLFNLSTFILWTEIFKPYIGVLNV